MHKPISTDQKKEEGEFFLLLLLLCIYICSMARDQNGILFRKEKRGRRNENKFHRMQFNSREMKILSICLFSIQSNKKKEEEEKFSMWQRKNDGIVSLDGQQKKQ